MAALFGAAESGSAQIVKLNNDAAFTGFTPGVGFFQITPDSTRVVYQGVLTAEGKFSVYSAPIGSAGGQVLLSDAVANTNAVGTFAITPDSSRVVYAELIRSAGRFDLHGASATLPGTQITLREGVATGTGGVLDLQITRDGTLAVYRSNDVNSGIFSISPTVPGVPLRVNGNLVAQGGIDRLRVIETPQGNRVVFAGDIETNNVIELFSASLEAAGTQIKLNLPPPPGGRVDNNTFSSFTVTPDGSSVFYTGDLITDGRPEMFRASTTVAGSQTTISTITSPDGGVFGFRLKPDGSSVFYVGDLLTNDEPGLFEAATVGPPNQRLAYRPSLVYTRLVDLALTPNGANLILRGALTTPGVLELYTASTTFLLEPRRLTNLSGLLDVDSFRMSSDAAFLAYRQRESVGESLWVVSTSGNFAPVQIAPAPGQTLEIQDYAISPDDQRVVFLASTNTVTPENIFSAPIPNFTTVANPNPPGAPVGEPGTPPPSSTQVPPTLEVSGKAKIATTKKRVNLKGIATDDETVTSVLLTYKKVTKSGKKKSVTRPAKLSGTGWTLKYRPRQKRTVFNAVAVDNVGLRSPIGRVIVIKK